MYYYNVWVRSNRYHGSEALTYASAAKLATGSVVEVALQRETVPGLITAPTARPRFQTKPISRVFELPALPAHLLKLAEWLKDYYPASIGAVTQQFLPVHLSAKQLEHAPARSFPTPDLSKLPPLTNEQKNALAAMQSRNTYLLHGKTGSGKTRLYIELTAQAIAEDTSAIILTPEISLTTQLAASFRAVFSDRVIVMHSGQTPAERQSAWLASLQATGPVIIIGPRSALFSPVAKPGLIVLDESHEAAYKQEQSPQYQTGRVAAYLARLSRATLVLGSATPSISDYYLAEQKQKPIIQLLHLAGVTKERSVKTAVVDMKDRSQFSRSPYLSTPLLGAIETALGNHQQSLLYLNRRGTARLIMCDQCGWQATCPHCDLPLTYHGDSHDLRCHSCSYHNVVPSQCPQCGNPSIMFKTAGTKAIVEEVKRLFPEARIGRYDTDNTKSERFEQHYEAVHSGEIDILIGTQLLAKGLDLPKLSTLGIVIADTSLYLPDFSAQERSFQLISQVMGRIGRGHTTAHAVVQTYHPENALLQAAIAQDYETFYATELAERRAYLFPPFCYLLKLTIRRASSNSAETAAERLKSTIETGGYHLRVEGPAPSFYEKIQNKYQWQLVVKATERSEVTRLIADLPSGWLWDIDPVDLL
jgi:primosomal protein N' (replication factor Y) (superfamily II helicase)